MNSNSHFESNEQIDFVTIVGTSLEAVTAEFCARGLSQQDFSIVSRIGRHQFMMADGAEGPTMPGGGTMIAATYARRPQR